MVFDPSGDYATVWDSTEAVKFSARRGPGVDSAPAVVVSVATALRGQVSEKERAATGGVYTGFDLKWFLPNTLLSSQSPKPGDAVVDTSGIRWTVLSREYDSIDQVWELTCVDLALANDLRELVSILRPANRATPGAGRAADLAIVYRNVKARIQEIKGEERNELGRIGTTYTYQVVLAEQLSVTMEDVVEDEAGNLYEIQGWTNPQRIDELQVLDCTAHR